MSKNKKMFVLLLLFFLVVSVLFICPDNGTMISGFHSSQLKQRFTKESNSVRTDYVDENGIIRYAADVGYATRIAIESDSGTIEKFLDDKGELLKRYYGYYEILREFDKNGNNVRITYLDIDGNPLNTGMGYATEERTFNEKKQITSVRYKDASGAPALTSLYGYGKINEYDDNGKVFKTSFVDISGQPMMTNQGYASIIHQYYPDCGSNSGEVENEFYLDEYGEPVALSLGQYGLHKEYNELGQIVLLTYLDQDGEPKVTPKGYTTIIRTFKADNSVATEQYFDVEGNPFSLPEGQYGVKRENGETIFLNEKGSETFNLRIFLYNKTWIVIPIALIVIAISSVTSRKWNVLFILFSILSIVYLTLMFRDNIGNKGQELLYSYRNIFTNSEGRADIIRNIWLFIPFGAILYKLYPHKKVLFIPLVLSIVIEVIQYYTNIGFCELDDIISNSLGGCIGFYVGQLTEELIDRINKWNRIHSA